jgi:hypothetical protein
MQRKESVVKQMVETARQQGFEVVQWKEGLYRMSCPHCKFDTLNNLGALRAHIIKLHSSLIRNRN